MFLAFSIKNVLWKKNVSWFLWNPVCSVDRQGSIYSSIRLQIILTKIFERWKSKVTGWLSVLSKESAFFCITSANFRSSGNILFFKGLLIISVKSGK